MHFPCSWKQGQSLLCAAGSLVSPVIAWHSSFLQGDQMNVYMVVKSGKGLGEAKPQAAVRSFKGWGTWCFVLALCRKYLLVYFKMSFKMSVPWFQLRVCISFVLKLVMSVRLCLNLILMTKNGHRAVPKHLMQKYWLLVSLVGFSNLPGWPCVCAVTGVGKERVITVWQESEEQTFQSLLIDCRWAWQLPYVRMKSLLPIAINFWYYAITLLILMT